MDHDRSDSSSSRRAVAARGCRHTNLDVFVEPAILWSCSLFSLIGLILGSVLTLLQFHYMYALNTVLFICCLRCLVFYWVVVPPEVLEFNSLSAVYLAIELSFFLISNVPIIIALLQYCYWCMQLYEKVVVSFDPSFAVYYLSLLLRFISRFHQWVLSFVSVSFSFRFMQRSSKYFYQSCVIFQAKYIRDFSCCFVTLNRLSFYVSVVAFSYQAR
jgi:hypothetical protein